MDSLAANLLYEELLGLRAEGPQALRDSGNESLEPEAMEFLNRRLVL